jgi:hypothetical protein
MRVMIIFSIKTHIHLIKIYEKKMDITIKEQSAKLRSRFQNSTFIVSYPKNRLETRENIFKDTQNEKLP